MARPRGSLIVQLVGVNEGRVLPFPGYRESVARYNPRQDNNSLDAESARLSATTCP
jgi:hypothetical protein